MTLASFKTTAFAPDRLLAGPDPVSMKITLLSGENRTRGAVLGKDKAGASDAGAADAGNTGDGTIGTVSAGTGAQEGVYVITLIETVAALGTFQVEDPLGVVIGTGVVGTAFTGEVVFTISDGAVDFVAGDIFRITIAAGTGKFILSVAAATDGTEDPDVILAEDTDASAADKTTVAYVRGEFNENALTLGAGHTAASIRDALRLKGIHLKASQGA